MSDVSAWPKFDEVDGITDGRYLSVLRGLCEPWVEGDDLDDGVAPEQVAETSSDCRTQRGLLIRGQDSQTGH